jgi:hypothetical protein
VLESDLLLPSRSPNRGGFLFVAAVGRGGWTFFEIVFCDQDAP